MVLAASVLAATPADVDRDAEAIFHDYMSPYCPELLLADCRSPAAYTLRAEVRRQLEQGTSAARVRAELDREFGEALWAAPRPHGFGLIAWLVPFAFVFLGGAALLLWLRSARAPASREPQPSMPSARDPALLSRFEEELRSWR